MTRHLLLSALVMVLGLLPILFVRMRYGEGRTTLRRFAIAYAVALLVIAGVSAASETYRRRCPDDPMEWCEYNDSVAAIATIAVGFAIVGAFRAWMLYNDR